MVSLFVLGATAPIGPGTPHSRGFFITHNDASQSVGLLWTSDQFVAETSILQHTTVTTDNIHAPGGIRTNNLSRRAAADLRLRPRGHWDRQNWYCSRSFLVLLFLRIAGVSHGRFMAMRCKLICQRISRNVGDR